jgi:FPC/CPF motif-containing protein YcgG
MKMAQSERKLSYEKERTGFRKLSQIQSPFIGMRSREKGEVAEYGESRSGEAKMYSQRRDDNSNEEECPGAA